jgi:alcohol dehydrogenase class IV
MKLVGNWNYPTSIRFGNGRVSELAAAVKSTGIARPLLVTDPRLAEMPMVAAVLAQLQAAGVPAKVFSAIQPNPIAANVAAGIAALKAGKHDGVIAFGGGSALDAGKVIAFMAGQTRPMWDFEDVGDWWTRADPNGILPIIAVPTTAGTGSEVGRAGVITDETTHTKKVIFHPLMMPKITICDPELTAGMPPFLTAGTGMDALAHCLEAYCGTAYHPLADGVALEGMRLVKDNLVRAYKTGSDLEARGHMMSAAAMGATAFQKALGAIHALSHPVGSHYDTQRGVYAVRAGVQSPGHRDQDRAGLGLSRPEAGVHAVPRLGDAVARRLGRSAHAERLRCRRQEVPTAQRDGPARSNRWR